MDREALARILLSGFPDLVFVLGPDDIFLAYHAQDDRQLAVPPERFLGQQASRALPHLWSQIEPLASEVRHQGEARALRYRVETPLGNFPYEMRILPAGGGELLFLVRNIQELQQTEEQNRKQIDLLEALRKIHVICTSGGDAGRVFEQLLRVVLRATESEAGVLAEVRSAPGEEPELFVRAFLSVPPGGTLCDAALQGEATSRGLLAFLEATLRAGQPLVASEEEGRGELPAGVGSVLGVPFCQGGRCLGVLGLVNRAGGYRPEQAASLAPLLESCAHLISFYRSQEARELAEAERTTAQREAERYRRLFELSNVNVAVISSDGVLVDVNPAFLRALGWGQEEILGTDAMGLIHPEDLPTATEYFERIFGGQEVTGFVARHRCKDGGYRWLLSNGIRDPEQSLFYGVSIDITERKEFERQVVAAREEALAASRMKSQFLANMSHEIRTPINGILGATSLLLSQELPGGTRDYLETIRDSGRILLATINNVLDVSKIEAGKLALERIPFSLPVLVDDTLRLFASEAEGRGIALRGELAADLPAFWYGDPVRIRQILINLLGNALKFTEVGGVTVGFRLRDDGVILGEVTDTGPGVPEAQRGAIFEPFTQGDGSTTRKYGGSGLGLAICRELVTLMGGEIRCDEAPGGGARFSFTLALDRASEVPPPPRPSRKPTRESASRSSTSKPPAAGTLRLLLAEDNATNAKITRKILERSGHDVDVVGNGQEALDAWRTRGFDLILMDVQMPVMDGLEATRRIRDEERTRGQRTPVVALTANVLSEDIERCLASGMDAYLAKPFERETLLALIERLQGASGEKKR
jgi:PAS domain S-box-containing protein